MNRNFPMPTLWIKLVLAVLLCMASVAPLAVPPAAASPGRSPMRAGSGGGTVVAWGCGSGYDSGQCVVPAGLSDVTAIAAGGYFGGGHSLALKSDGTVVAWGSNIYGESTVPAGLNGVTAISAGVYHNLALKSDGTVVAWGFNGDGEATVPGGLTGVIAIAAGGWHSMALKSDGTVMAWGRGDEGQTSVPAGLTGVTAIAAGWWHGLALKSDGTVVAWGCGVYQDWGQCTVPAGLSGVTAIAAGGYFGGSHSLALKGDGTVVAWGATTAPAGLSGVMAIAAGNSHSLALKADGMVVAWGANFAGETTVPAGLTGVTAIAAGSYNSLAIVHAGSLTVDAGGPYTVTEGASITVTASGSDPEGGPLTYAWDLDGNGTFETPGQAVTYTAALGSAGTHTITVQATDNGGLSATDSAVVDVQPSNNQAVKLFAVSRQGGDSTNEVYRYTVTGPNDPAQLEMTITRPNITNPYGLAFSATGELYVSNAYVNPSIARLLDPVEAATANGAIADASLTNPVGIVIRDGLLYVGQTAGNVRIFSLNASGNGTLIGTISDHLSSVRNVAINPTGTELLVAQCCGGDSVVRYTIDGPGVVTFKGVINGNGLGGSHDLVFSPWGELFVANAHNNSVSRFVFDAAGNVSSNGQITGPMLNGPIGLDFSSWGELFIANHFGGGGISRFTFDSARNAIPNGFFATPNTLADIQFYPAPTTGNQPPTVDAGGPYSVNEGASIIVTASGSDPEGGALTYEWDLDNDGVFETPGQGVTFSAAGLDGPSTHTVAVRATDGSGLSGTDQATVTVENVALSITSVSNSGPIDEGASATITVTATDAAGANDPLSYEFDCDGDGTYEIGPQPGNTTSCAYDDNGNFVVTVRVSDGDGGADIGSTTVTVNNAEPTIITVSNTGPIYEGSSATITVTATDAGGVNDPLSYKFDCDGDGVYEVGPQPANSYNCYYDDNADYVVNVHVSDDDEGTNTASTTVTVNNDKPTATFTNSTDLVISGEFAILIFTDSSDPSIADREAGFTYLYDCLSDGVFESGDTSAISFACQYLNSGVYTPTGRIQDKDGGYTDYNVVVTVLTPEGATESVIDDVEDLVNTGALNQGRGNSLITKLENVIQKLNMGNTNAAINQLQAFINQVNDLIATGVLTPEEGQPLIDVADRIIAALGG